MFPKLASGWAIQKRVVIGLIGNIARHDGRVINTAGDSVLSSSSSAIEAAQLGSEKRLVRLRRRWLFSIGGFTPRRAKPMGRFRGLGRIPCWTGWGCD